MTPAQREKVLAAIKRIHEWSCRGSGDSGGARADHRNRQRQRAVND